MPPCLWPLPVALSSYCCLAGENSRKVLGMAGLSDIFRHVLVGHASFLAGSIKDIETYIYSNKKCLQNDAEHENILLPSKPNRCRNPYFLGTPRLAPEFNFAGAIPCRYSQSPWLMRENSAYIYIYILLGFLRDMLSARCCRILSIYFHHLKTRPFHSSLKIYECYDLCPMSMSDISTTYPNLQT